jgi:hypothetical protein
MREKLLHVLGLLFVATLPALAIDREAFTFTSYDLDARIERAQQRCGVRGHVTLRNDSNAPQAIAVLQISSTLDWRSIRVEGNQLQFVSQPYTSDVDHTGSFSEAIVTLPRELKPKESIEIEVGYEGTIALDATRLTRIGTPAAKAKSSDWDQIASSFTAVRGVGYVAWYPIAVEAASLAQGNSVFDAVGRWKAREAGSEMKIRFVEFGDAVNGPAADIICNDVTASTVEQLSRAYKTSSSCEYAPLGITVPSFVMAKYSTVTRGPANFFFFPNHKEEVEGYEAAADQVLPLVTDWFGDPKGKTNALEIPDSGSAPFETGNMTLMPMTNPDRGLARITLVHGITHAAFSSSRPWVSEGIAHFMQALERNQLAGRKAALDYMGLHRVAFLASEQAVAGSKAGDAVSPQPLIATFDESYYRSKAMYVWWMLRDMVEEPTLKKAIRKYRADEDDNPKYVEALVETESKRDLAWFFEDWVYQDKGLPDFRVESAFPRKTEKGSYLLTVTIVNGGMAGAEVPFTVSFNGGEIVQRIEVRGKAKAITRVEVPGSPQQVVVNDGSVPESDLTNNTFTISSQ